jgi:anti-sigma B factor antagonist
MMSITGKPIPVMTVAVLERTAYVRIPGRANFTSSIDFKTLVNELKQRGFDHFVLDLTGCQMMDSTFLGVLAGLALRNADGKEIGAGGQKLILELLNPNARIAELLENLGVVHLFTILNEPCPSEELFKTVESNGPAPTKEDISKNCLDAHKTLMDLNPDNIPKFKDVAKFLAEDLRRPKNI